MNVLPAQWTEGEIGDLVELLKNGISVPQNRDGHGIPVTRIETIATGKINPDRIGFVSDVAAEDASAHRLHTGDILFSHINSSAHLGKTAIYIGEPSVLFHGTNLLLVRACKDVCNPRYLEYGFRHMRASRVFELNAQHAVNQASLNQAKLRKLVLPVAPLNEQKRIADKLDAVLARVDACRERLDRIPAILKRFRQSVLAAATSGKLTEEWRERNSMRMEQWNNYELREVVLGIEQGWSPKCEDRSAVGEDEWAVIKTSAVQPLDFLDFENKALPGVKTPRPELEIKSGDLLITRAGPRSRAAICCLVREVRARLMICDKVYRFRANGDLILPEYLAYFLNAPRSVALLDRMKTGISDSGVNLTQGKFLQIGVYAPPLPEQREIIRRVEMLLNHAGRIESSNAVARSQIERLTPALLAKAFRGELVPQDPNDEPASALLERLRGSAGVDRDTKRRRSTG